MRERVNVKTRLNSFFHCTRDAISLLNLNIPAATGKNGFSAILLANLTSRCPRLFLTNETLYFIPSNPLTFSSMNPQCVTEETKNHSAAVQVGEESS